jgi:hypothetical protein
MRYRSGSTVSIPSGPGGSANDADRSAALRAASRAILCAAGCRTGLYTSPHLLSFTERIRVDGEAIGEEAIVGLTARLQALCAEHFAPETVRPPAGRLPHPTFFELTTAMAFLHFRRQQVISGFIADFYCHQAGLAVEVDGPSHTDPEYDKARDAVFETLGIRVVRVTNEQVVHQIEDVLEYILRHLRERTAP